jgi:predicted peptidase
MHNSITKLTLMALVAHLPLGVQSQTVNYQQNNSMRNYQLSHYYKMVSWDDSQYKEATYYKTNSTGGVMEFMNWRIIFPAGYSQTGSTKYPMILMLHGAGESGREWTGNFTYTPTDPRYDNNGNNLLWGGREHRDAVNRASTDSRSFPGIVVFPQVSYNGAWSGAWDGGNLSNNNRMAVTVVEHLISNFNADPNRIYVHGLSAGAKGVWDIVAKRPDLFAAMLPMSGVGSDINAMTDILVTTPIWLFQGGLDTNPSPGYSKQWIDALKAKGGDPRYTVYPNLGHGTWNTAYAEPDFFSWMKSKDKRNIYVFGGSTVLDVNPAIKLGFSAGFIAYQWLKDGAEIPGANSRYYTASEPGDYKVRFTRRTDGATIESFATTITTTGPPPPPPVVQNGLNYKNYAGYKIDRLTSFDFSRQPTTSGVINNFTNNVKTQGSDYVLSFDGEIQIDNTGSYIFYTNSDEGSQLFINGTLVVDNDGIHEARIASGSYNFSTTGKYPIRVTYFQAKSKQTLEVRYNQGLVNNYSLASNIPDNKLFVPSSGTSSSGRIATNSTEAQTLTSITSDSTTYASSEANLILVYPNPVETELHIQFRDEEMETQPVSLRNLTNGVEVMRLLAEPYNTETVLDMSTLSPGQYVLSVGRRKFRIIKRN